MRFIGTIRTYDRSLKNHDIKFFVDNDEDMYILKIPMSISMDTLEGGFDGCDISDAMINLMKNAGIEDELVD